jgi:RNA polymerase sigma factor (sigma-70 family)
MRALEDRHLNSYTKAIAASSDAADSSATNVRVSENYLLAMRHALNWSTSESLDDRFQDSLVGLVEASNRFDRQNGATFGAYARPWIHKELRLGSRMRFPTSINEEGLRLLPTLSQALERGELGTELAALHAASVAAETTSGDAAELVEIDCHHVGETLSADLLATISSLPPAALTILSFRYGLSGCGQHTLAETAELFSVSPQAIHKREQAVIEQLRKVLLGN